MSLTVDDVKNIIRNLDDVSLKIITDLVAYWIHKGPYDRSPGENYISAENSVALYVSETIESLEELKNCLNQLGGGMKGIELFANRIYGNYYKKHPDFNTIKEFISAKKDISLKAITDIVAYKISQSPNDNGPEINYITAETFVAQYISTKYKNIENFKVKLRKYGDNINGVQKFAEMIYDNFYS